MTFKEFDFPDEWRYCYMERKFDSEEFKWFVSRQYNGIHIRLIALLERTHAV